jgi:membrane protease YdiL (CAAX protease family)
LVLLILMLISFLGATLHFRFSSTPHWARLGVYAWGILMEWSLLLYIAYGVRTRGVSMRELIGPIKPGLGAGLRDFFLAVGFLFVADLILVLVGGVLRPPPSRAIENIIPHGNVETAIYLLLCVSAGICEELVFRGYLQRQFAAFTGSASMALILQGLFFGISHGYQGVTRMFIIAILGCMLGVLARRRGNLRPGMIAHFLQDAVAGILASRLMK